MPAEITPRPHARTPQGQAGLDAITDLPSGALIATDYDGTLAPIVDDPADAAPAPGEDLDHARLAAEVARERAKGHPHASAGHR